MRKGQFEKGNPGKLPGTLNKLTITVRDTVLSVFNDLQTDPHSNLLSWAKSEPTEFYKIAAKLIPTEINHSLDNKVIRVIIPKSSDLIKDAEILP